MIVCFALGIANCIRLNVVLIVLSAICLSVPSSPLPPHPNQANPPVLQPFLLRNPLHRSAPAPAHLPDVVQVRRRHPQDHDQLHARGRLRRHGAGAVADAADRRDVPDRRRRAPDAHGLLLPPRGHQGPGVCRQQDVGRGRGGADDCMS